ncbi:MAG TPA: phosphatase PAP2 family protein [Kofleriaceae bacterium]
MRRHVVLGCLAAAVFVTVCAIVVPVEHRVGLDMDIATWIAAHRGDTLVSAAKAASFAGSVFGIVPLSLLVAWYLQRRDGWHSVRWYAIAIIGATIVYLALNHVFDRDRPPIGLRLALDTRWSFPSGHSTQAIVFWPMTALLVTARRPPIVQLYALGAALLCALAIGGSRICLCAHWTTDVLGGFALGACWLACVLAWRARAELTPAVRIEAE